MLSRPAAFGLVLLLVAGLPPIRLCPAGPPRGDAPTDPNAGVAATGAPQEPSADGRLDWWRAARFGMFIHWGLYALPAGEWNGRTVPGAGEWIMHEARIPVADYEPLVARFNPLDFDADAWARIAKDAGMRYVVITTKHHDGFCLFDSQATEYDVMSTPFRRDIMKELAEACRRHGLRIGWYHSILDWHHPDYLPRRPWDERPAAGADFERYVRHLHRQVRELLTGYGPIGVMWFDGEWEDTWTHAHGRALYDLVRGLQPQTIVNNRVDKGRVGMAGLTRGGDWAGDFGTPEQEVPPTGLPGVDWETCMTMNDSWGFKRSDKNWKPAEVLIRTLVDVASKGGNFLLNVGPTAEGVIPPESVERLRVVGRWLRANGESIYGTSAGPFRFLPFDGRCTVRGSRLYVHVFEWPADGVLTLHGVRNRARDAQLLSNCRLPDADGAPRDAGAADGRIERDPGGGGAGTEVQRPGRGAEPSFAIEQVDQTITIRGPTDAPDPVDSVVVVELDGPPDVDPAFVVRQSSDGSVRLQARVAEVHGRTARYEHGAGKDNIGYWTDPADWVSWPVKIDRGGAFDVSITLAADAGSGGSPFVVTFRGPGEERSLSGIVHETGSWTTFETISLGAVRLDAGRCDVAVRALGKPGLAVMNLKEIRLTRSGD